MDEVRRLRVPLFDSIARLETGKCTIKNDINVYHPKRPELISYMCSEFTNDIMCGLNVPLYGFVAGTEYDTSVTEVGGRKDRPNGWELW